jgi:hypothetical protein
MALIGPWRHGLTDAGDRSRLGVPLRGMLPWQWWPWQPGCLAELGEFRNPQTKPM